MTNNAHHRPTLHAQAGELDISNPMENHPLIDAHGHRLGEESLAAVDLRLTSTPAPAKLVLDGAMPKAQDLEVEEPALRVLTLNLAHGRQRAFHQALLAERRIRKNLLQVARMLLRERPCVVALQEADGPSYWSGRFDHVAYLAQRAKLPHAFLGSHTRWGREGQMLNYGTALLSRFPLVEPRSECFARTVPPTPRKGFVMATVPLPEPHGPYDQVEVVSVHLDFLFSYNRKRQVEHLICTVTDRLAEDDRPLLVLGDMNCQWLGREQTLRYLVENLRLQVFEPDIAEHISFQAPWADMRFDWVMASHHFHFVRHQILPDQLSDHFGVVADLNWA